MKLDSDEINAIADAVAVRLAGQVQSIATELAARTRADDTPVPLSDILDGTDAANRQRIARDPELRALGVVVAGRLRFTRSQVLALLEARTKAGKPLRMRRGAAGEAEGTNDAG